MTVALSLVLHFVVTLSENLNVFKRLRTLNDLQVIHFFSAHPYISNLLHGF